MSSSQGYLHRLTEHRAAVKAIAWCPYQSNILASGGGTADRCVKMWNTQTGQCISSTDTQSQVKFLPLFFWENSWTMHAYKNHWSSAVSNLAF